MSALNAASRRVDQAVEMANRIRHKRQEVINGGSHYIGERNRVTGKIMRRPDLGGAMLFWEAYGKKQDMNTGRKTPRFFVIDAHGTIVSTIAHKIKTIPNKEVPCR